MDNLIDVVDEANCHTSDTDSGCDVYTEDPIRKVLRGIEHFPEEIIEKIRLVFFANLCNGLLIFRQVQ